MVYPVFEYTSIKKRCALDIAQFIKETIAEEKKKGNIIILNDNVKYKLYTPASTNTLKILKDKLKPLLIYFKDNLKYTFTENDKDTVKTGTYIEIIPHILPALQYQLWIARTYLFYQLLIYATGTFLYKSLYNDVYTDRGKFPYMPELTKDNLKDFKMGIFGSMTPTSDIDIGIQYSGMETIIALAHIVSRFECLFLIFTGNDSLSYDIETYADMMTIPQIGGADYFYLDSSEFGPDEFIKMLPFAGASIIRNIVCTQEPPSPFSGSFDEIITNRTFNQKMSDQMNILSDFPKEVHILLNTSSWFSKATKMVNEFMALDKEERRYAYYTKVKEAEDMLFKYIPTRTDIPQLDKTAICDIMVKIGEALVYRMESYTCAPTVIHVVRILQASTNFLKYKTATPQLLCKGEFPNLEPYCTIGSYGYILSMLEQIGYAYRFYLTYCISNHANKAKCKKKINKYRGRYLNAIHFLQNRRTTNIKLLRMRYTLRSIAARYVKKKQIKKKYTRKTHHTRKIRKSSAKTHSKSN